MLVSTRHLYWGRTGVVWLHDVDGARHAVADVGFVAADYEEGEVSEAAMGTC